MTGSMLLVAPLSSLKDFLFAPNGAIVPEFQTSFGAYRTRDASDMERGRSFSKRVK